MYMALNSTRKLVTPGGTVKHHWLFVLPEYSLSYIIALVSTLSGTGADLFVILPAVGIAKDGIPTVEGGLENTALLPTFDGLFIASDALARAFLADVNALESGIITFTNIKFICFSQTCFTAEC
jgi:hypothetical protein